VVDIVVTGVEEESDVRDDVSLDVVLWSR